MFFLECVFVLSDAWLYKNWGKEGDNKLCKVLEGRGESIWCKVNFILRLEMYFEIFRVIIKR